MRERSEGLEVADEKRKGSAPGAGENKERAQVRVGPRVSSGASLCECRLPQLPRCRPR